MAFTRGTPVTGKSGASITSFSIVLGTTASRSIAIGVIWKDAANNDPTSVTITGESNATTIGSPVRSTALSASQQLYYLGNNTGGGSKTITVNFATAVGKVVLLAIEYIGGDTAAFLDASATGTGTTANPSISLTTATANAAILAIVSSKKSTPTAGTGYTQITLPSLFWFDEAEDKLDAGSAGAKTVDFTVGAAAWMICAASFAPAGSGTTEIVSAASISYVGSSVKVNELIVIANGTISYVGRTVTTLVTTTISVANATISYLGQNVTPKIDVIVSIANGTISLTGQAVTPIVSGIVEIANATISYVGQAVTTRLDATVQIANATISYVGRNVNILVSGLISRTRNLWHKSPRRGHWW